MRVSWHNKAGRGWGNLPAVLLLLAMVPCSSCSSFGLGDPEFSRQVLLQESPSAERLHRRGVRLTRAGKLAEAETAFGNAILADETFGPAHNNLGLLSYKRGDLYSAARSFESAMRFLPERAEPMNNLAMTLEAGGRYQEAIDLYQAAAGLDPANPEYLGNLVRTRLRRGDIDWSLKQQLEELAFIETRPDWRAFAQRQLVMLSRVSNASQPEFGSDAVAPVEGESEELPSPPLPLEFP